MASIFDMGPGRVPITGPDTTRSWVESIRGQQKAAGKGDMLKPACMLRFATDANYIRNQTMPLYADHPRPDAQSKAIMNTVLPGMRLPGILNFQVNEADDTITSTASFELLNCLPISQTQTTLTSHLPRRHHNPTIKSTFVGNSLFVVDRIDGNVNVSYREDRHGYGYREERVKYRIFEQEPFSVINGGGFPNPAIPNDDDNDIPDDAEYENSNSGSGSYFILIGGSEVVRVCRKSGNTFFIPPGGRAVNGYLGDHGAGSSVQLLGYAPYNGEWTSLGYLTTDDFRPQKSLLRPGSCIVSYEGWGDISGLLTHSYDPGRNYQFTGYWFISGSEPSIGEDGVPRVRVDLKGAGQMYDGQKTSPDMLQRIKSQFGQWLVGQREANAAGRTIWQAANHDRNIAGDWVDYNSWDPSHPESYPLKIKTEWAQHKEFFDHMEQSEMGRTCEYCRQEHAEWLKSNNSDPKRAVQEAKSVGKHIYKSSIRVLHEEAGPIKTYIRLMSTIAAAAWDHPAYGTEASYRFTKIPNKLYDNIRNIHTGLIYNGQSSIELDQTTPGFRWDIPTYDDSRVIGDRNELVCPFESVYDKAPFSQPMMDLAEINDSKFWVRREGYPVFVPRLWPFRPPGWTRIPSVGYRNLARTQPFPVENSEWFMCYGASISGYSHSIQADAVLTQVWVTCTTAFESTFTIASGGTGIAEGGTQRINFSPLGGNKEGLGLTAGVQQVDTISLDNLKLGLDWNTNPANWGMQILKPDGSREVEGRPPLYDGSPPRNKGDKGEAVKRIQRTINFFLERRYLNPVKVGDKWHYTIGVGGVFGEVTEECLKSLQRFLNHRIPAGSVIKGLTLSALDDSGVYNRATYLHILYYLEHNKYFLQRDPWWYVLNGYKWDEYVAAITGVPIPVKSGKKQIKSTSKNAIDVPRWVPDEKGMQREIDKWQRGFAKDAINFGNKVVDDSINKATVRSISSNMADPRIQPADVIWAEVPGHLGARTGDRMSPPFTNGIFVQSIGRQMDLANGTYTATYSGHRYRGEIGFGLSRSSSKGYEFVN